MIFEITAEINGLNGRLETRLFGNYTDVELKTLDKLLNYAIISRESTETRKKTNWVKGAKGLFAGSVLYGSKVRLAKGEYKKIVSEINTNYGKYEGKEYCIHPSVWHDKYYTYEFINYGFDDYEFKRKRRG